MKKPTETSSQELTFDAVGPLNDWERKRAARVRTVVFDETPALGRTVTIRTVDKRAIMVATKCGADYKALCKQTGREPARCGPAEKALLRVASQLEKIEGKKVHILRNMSRSKDGTICEYDVAFILPH